METQTKSLTMLSIEPGSIIARRYEVCDKLGSGGMGVVYRVIDRELNDEVVALKLLHPHLAQDEEVFARFRNEVLVARALSHPNIVRIHDMGRAEQGFSYISMEFVDGYSLADRIAPKAVIPGMPNEPLTFDEALSTLYQICCGVAYAHDKGIIHRDLKPANVMISKRGEVKLADFGTARIMGMDRSLTQAGQVIGTPDYMSPEQIKGERLDASCDIYALGVIGYELAVGRKPFIAESAVAVAFKHLNEPVPEFARPGTGIPKWFEEVIWKATAKERAQRFSSAFEFAHALSERAPELTGTAVLFVPELRANALRNAAAASATVDPVYQLGGEQESSGDSWVVGTTMPPPKPPLETISPTTVAKARSPIAIGLLGFGLCFALVLLAVRLVPGVNGEARRVVEGLEESTGKDLSAMRALFGIARQSEPPVQERVAAVVSEGSRIPPVVPPTDPSTKPVEELKDKKQLEAELLAEAGVTAEVPPPAVEVPATEEAPTVTTAAEESSSIPAVSPIEVVKEEAPSTVEAPTQVAALKSEEKPAPPPEPPAPTSAELFEASELSAALIVTDGQRAGAVHSAALDKLGNVEWRAVVNGLPTGIQEPVLRKLIRDRLTVSVHEAASGKQVAILESKVQKLPTPEDASLQLSGSLAGARSELAAGNYRLQIAKGEQVLKTRDLGIYRASISLSDGTPSDSGGQRINIVRGPSYVPGEEPTARPEVVPDTPPVPPAEMGGLGVSTGVPPRLDLVTTPRSPVDGSSLPPARRSAEQLLARSETHEIGSQLTAPATPVGQPSARSEIYSGKFSREVAGGALEEQALELTLSFTPTEITGTATIEGFGQFAVDGKIYPRGLEMNLRGPTSIRLTGSMRDSTLRGRYNVPSEQRSGRWVATKR